MASADEGLAELQQKIAKHKPSALLGGGVATATCTQAGSWTDTLAHGLDFVREHKLMSADWVADEKRDLSRPDPQLFLRKAERLTEILSAGDGQPWADWLRSSFGELTPQSPHLIEAILDLNLPIMTTNFDDLIEHVSAARGVPLKPLTWLDAEEVANNARLDGCVLHLHGHWKRPETVVFGYSSYIKRTEREIFMEIALRFIASRGLLYIGCGATLDDPHIAGLRDWLRRYGATAKGVSFRLVNLAERTALLADKTAASGDYSTILYGSEHSDLAPFVRRLRPPDRVPPARVESRAATLQPYVEHVAQYWGILDLPVPPGANRPRKDPVDRLYVDRTFVLEGEQRDPATPPSSFTAQQAVTNEVRTVRLADRLEAGAPLLIVADAGMGKTALSRRLAWVYAQRRLDDDRSGPAFALSDLPDKAWLPVLVPGALLRESDASGGLEGFVGAALRAPGFHAEWAASIAQAANDPAGPGIVLIVDGVDEISPRSLREQLVERLILLAGKCAIVVTSRREGLEGELRTLSDRFEHLRLEPLDVQQSTVFLDAYVGPATDPEARVRRNRIDQAVLDPRVSDIARVPLGLVMLALRSTLAGSVGENLSDLLRWMVGELIERRGAKLDPPLEARHVVPVLQFLAYEITRRDEDVLSQDSLEELLGTFTDFRRLAGRREAPAFLAAVIETTNLLVKRGVVDGGQYDENTYGFLFKQVREYLAAGALVAGRQGVAGANAKERFLQKVAATPVAEIAVAAWELDVSEPSLEARWLSPLVLVPAQMLPEDAQEVVRALVAPSGDSDPTRRARAQLAARSLAEIRDPSPSTVVAVADACIAVANQWDSARSTQLSEAVRRMLNRGAFEPAANRFAEYVALEPAWPNRIAVLSWLSEAALQEWINGRSTSGLPDVALVGQRAGIHLLGTPDSLADLLAPLDHPDPAERAKAGLRLLEIGYESETTVLAELPPMIAATLGERLVHAARAPQADARIAAHALVWLTKATLLDQPAPQPDPQLVEMLVEGVTQPCTPEARAWLATTLAKVTTAPEDPYDQIYLWAQMADRAVPATPSQPRPRPETASVVLPAIAYAERRLTNAAPSQADPSGREPYELATMLARFGIVTDAGAAALATFLLQQQPDSSRTRETVMHLGRAGTLAAQHALLQIYRHSKRAAERQWCFLALIATGSQDMWQSMREVPSSQSDDLERNTLMLFLATANTERTEPPTARQGRGLSRFLRTIFKRR